MRLGIIILFFGVIMLLNSLGLLAGISWNVVWPIVVIMIGLSIMLRNDRNGGMSWRWGGCCGHGKCADGCVGACKDGVCKTCQTEK